VASLKARRKESGLEIEYEITPDDLYAFQWRANSRSSIAKRASRKAYLFLFLTFLLFALLPAIGPDGFAISRVNILWVVIVFPLIALMTWYLNRRQTRRAILGLLKAEKPGKGQLGSHKISLNDEGLVESTAVGESRTSWAGVDRVEQNREYIFIYTSPAGAHIIPKRAFSSLQEAECFYEIARASKQIALDGNPALTKH
jgi:hypothetical protein